MKYYRSEIVKQAQAWVGRKESDGSHKEIIDVYNSHKPLARGYKMPYTGAWCSAFASAVAIKCGYTKIIPTEVSCYYHIELFKKLGCWVENDGYIPAPGDYILYDWEDSGKGDNVGSPNHIGIVEKVENGIITVIDGNNSNDAVGRRTAKVNAKYIRGYGVPKYDGYAPEETTVEPVVLKYSEDNKIVLNGYLYKDSYGNGKGKKKTNYKGTITIVNKNGSKPYHIDSLGWVAESDIILNENTESIKKGDKVKVLRAVTYEGKKFMKWFSKYDVIEANGDRVVIGKGKIVTCAIKINNIEKI